MRVLTWVTDITHYDGVLDPSSTAPAAAKNIARFFGSIVQAATAWPSDDLLETAIHCRRRPKRRACPGRIRLVQVAHDPDGQPTDDFRIVWECAVCKDNGVIRNWRGTTWDLSDVERDDEFWDDDTLHVNLSDEEYLALRDAVSGTRPLLAVVIVTRSSDAGPVMEVTLGELQRLVAAVVEASRAASRTKRGHLETALAKLHRDLLGEGQVQ